MDIIPSIPACFNICQIQALLVTSEAMQTATWRDLLLSKVLHYAKHGWPTHVSNVFKPYQSKCLEFTMHGRGMLLMGHSDYLSQEPTGDHIYWVSFIKAIRVFQVPGQKLRMVARIGQVYIRPWFFLFCLSSCQTGSCSSTHASLDQAYFPWQCVHVDFAGPFLGKIYLIVVDAHQSCLRCTKCTWRVIPRPFQFWGTCLTYMVFQSNSSLILDLSSQQVSLHIFCNAMVCDSLFTLSLLIQRGSRMTCQDIQTGHEG